MRRVGQQVRCVDAMPRLFGQNLHLPYLNQ